MPFFLVFSGNIISFKFSSPNDFAKGSFSRGIAIAILFISIIPDLPLLLTCHLSLTPTTKARAPPSGNSLNIPVGRFSKTQTTMFVFFKFKEIIEAF